MYDELTKALRCCGVGGDGCKVCPYNGKMDCDATLYGDAADAIERLTAEVDRKDKVIHDMLNTLIQKEETIKRISEEMREQMGEYDEHLS